MSEEVLTSILLFICNVFGGLWIGSRYRNDIDHPFLLYALGFCVIVAVGVSHAVSYVKGDEDLSSPWPWFDVAVFHVGVFCASLAAPAFFAKRFRVNPALPAEVSRSPDTYERLAENDMKLALVREIIKLADGKWKFVRDILEDYAARAVHEYTHFSTKPNITMCSPEEANRQYARLFFQIYAQLPKNLTNASEGVFDAELIDLIQNARKTFSTLFYESNLPYRDQWARAWTILNEHVDLYDKPLKRGEIASWIEKYDGSTSQALHHFFLTTVWYDFFRQRVGVSLPSSMRVAHHYLTGGSGHGKTQTLLQMLAHDIRDHVTVVVIDSQNAIIPHLLKLDLPKERYVHIDPDDLEYPPALNLFDTGIDRFSGSARDRQANSIVEIYTFVLSSIMEADMTEKMKVAFAFAIQLMLLIPNATIHDLRKLFAGGRRDYQEYIEQLPRTAREFFENEFDSTGFRETNSAISWRLYSLLKNPVIERMFSHPKSKIDIRREVETPGKIICINTAPGALKDPGFKFFGRLWIGLILQAIRERDEGAHNHRVYLYIDEVQEYADEHIAEIMLQARKFGMGLIMANQNFGDLPEDVRRAIGSSTSIKMAGGINASDARALADNMNTDWRSLVYQPKFQFATFVRGYTDRVIATRTTPGFISQLPQRSDLEDLKQMNREKYTEPYVPRPEPKVLVATEEEIKPGDTL